MKGKRDMTKRHTIDGRVALNLVLSAVTAGAAAGIVSWQTQPLAPWQVHAGTAGVTALG